LSAIAHNKVLASYYIHELHDNGTTHYYTYATIHTHH